ncbi:uncharacterized protein Z518_03916 [Rhinocladiella mackenziei CBS 650.93]|uniref:Methyltransferase small domain-containing protein n=1 Tax=Rhinocladiella mackenziei CBS 650.93 TaxID=1442369 RepID=A0A0D2FV19_9EURO|nr:uncharacterized protein Z518_03916 [Rhinocladiella mackenziei CBS 650.93]KIX05942.1 hypothetical protein Z518_03916 [Rhinocladiella mackenziei CBS 650.93]
MLPTPSTSHVSYDTVYEPAEDSYLFLDTLSSAKESAWLHRRFECEPSPPTDRAASDAGTETGANVDADADVHLNEIEDRNLIPLLLELGPGSGVIVAFLSVHAREIFGTDVLGLSVDVNLHACIATATTVQKALVEKRERNAESESAVAQTPTRSKSEGDGFQNPSLNPNPAQCGGSGSGNGSGSIYLSSLLGDLAAPLRAGEVDVLVFNPPYVPTESVPAHDADIGVDIGNAKEKPTFAESSHLLELSYAGGQDGMQVTSRLLNALPTLLSTKGVAYVLFCRGNRPEEVKSWIRGWDGANDGRWVWCAETVGTSGRTAGWEKLEIVRIWREWKEEPKSKSESRKM